MKRESQGLLHGATVQRRKGSQLQFWDLPVGILCDIISRLPIRDAIRTSILSSQCKYLWCDHTNLVFTGRTLRSGYGSIPIDVPGFIAKTDAILKRHSGIGVKVMEVRCSLLRNTHADHIDRWVKFAVESRTKELRLHLSHSDVPIEREQAYNFPCHLFDGGSYVRCLKLTSVSLNLPPDMNGFLNLRKLTMVDVSITEEHLEYLMSSCNLLEILGIAYCRTLTSIRAVHHRMDRLKHLLIDSCTLLQRIQMNCALTTLEYTGPVVPLEFSTISSLRTVFINLVPFDSSTALDYITTSFPSNLPHLETFSLRCTEYKRAIFPVRPIKFMYLRHLRLEAIIIYEDHRNTDALDYAYFLDAAPFLEKLELHMWVTTPNRQPYHAEHGELRSLTSQSHQHTHLRSVYITGFFGNKDQVELALHILHTSAVLESMKIDPAVKINRGGPYAMPYRYDRYHYIDGRTVAMEFVHKADHNNVVQVVEASPRP